MILVRSPLRIPLGGGGTDLPSYYQQFGGCLVAAAIDKYVYVAINEAFNPKIIVKYSKIETVENVDQIVHPIVREALKLTGVTGPHLEIVSISDVPAGTGLGSSGSFTTGLLRALYAKQRKVVSPADLAELACHVEIDILREPVGKQDQYIAAYGGITAFSFARDGSVQSRPAKLSRDTINDLQDNLVMFFTGITRSASDILKDQDRRSAAQESRMIENLHRTKNLGHQSLQALENGDLEHFARLMHIHWEEKRKRTPGISNQMIDQCYELALGNGALGGKLIGAGGGGFLLLYAHDKPRLRRTLAEAGLSESRIRFDFDGTKVLSHG